MPVVPDTASRFFKARRLLAGAGLFVAGAVCLTLPSGYVYAPAIMLLLGFSLAVQVPDLPPADRRGFWLMAAFGLYSALMIWWHGDPHKGLAGYLSYLLVAPIAWVVLVLRPAPGLWFMGMATGAIMTGAWALWQKLGLGVERATGYIYVIQFGNIGLMLGVMSLLGLLYYRAHPRNMARDAWLLTGALAGAMVSVLSGTRGGWVGVPLLLWVLWRAFAPFLSVRARTMAVSLLLLGALAVLALPQTGVSQRIAQAHAEVQRHLAGESPGPSLGQRLQLWPLAGELIAQKPWLGWGQGGYDRERDRRMADGRLDLQKPFGHVHNDFLDVSVKRGLPAGLLLLGVLLMPLLVFRQGSGAGDPAVRALATAGVTLSVLALDFGLSDLMLESKSGRFVFMGWLPIIYALYRNQLAASQSVLPLARGTHPQAR